MVLGSLGLGGLGLGGIALTAAPYHGALLAAAAICLGAGTLALFWERRVRACTPATACARSRVTALLAGVLSLGAVLAVLGALYA
jgi:hypothetical protein